jgi:hypothetical protein
MVSRHTTLSSGYHLSPGSPVFASCVKNLGLNQGLSLMCVDSNEKFMLLQENFELRLEPHESRWFRVLA